VLDVLSVASGLLQSHDASHLNGHLGSVLAEQPQQGSAATVLEVEE
jgi:hypothetical protein